MRELLKQAIVRGMGGEYARHVLRAFDQAEQPVPAPHAAAIAGAPVERVTPRELEILRLIAAGLRNQEIAGQLFISTSTVKRHVANIYAKLGATHRAEAVAKASALRLL
jgi:ATP/maltotriose-dependent transcriptional regulator MalT